MKGEMIIDRAIVARYHPSMLKHGNVFKLTLIDEKNDAYTLQAYFKTTDGSIIRVNHPEAKYSGTIRAVKDAQLEFDFLKEAIREVVREEISK